MFTEQRDMWRCVTFEFLPQKISLWSSRWPLLTARLQADTAGDQRQEEDSHQAVSRSAVASAAEAVEAAVEVDNTDKKPFLPVPTRANKLMPSSWNKLSRSC